MTILTQTAALLRHLRSERGVALALVAIVAITSFVLASAPRLYNQMLDDELRYRVDEAPANWRNLSVTMKRRTLLEQEGTIIEQLDAGGAAYLKELEPTLQDVISGHGVQLDSLPSPFVTLHHGPPDPFRRSLQLRYQSNVRDQVTLEAGRWPVVREPLLLSDLMSTPGARGEAPYPRYEVALTQTSLDRLNLEPFDWFLVRLAGVGDLALVQAVGVISINDPKANYWNANERLHEPVVSGFGSDFNETLEATALAAPDAYASLLRHTGNATWDHSWIFYVDSSRLNVGNYQTVMTELRLLKATRGPTHLLAQGDPPLLAMSDSGAGTLVQQVNPFEATIHNEIPLVLERFAGQARLTSSVVAIQTIGILAVGLSAIGLFAALIAGRRRAMTTLLRGRGASRGQLAIAQATEGISLCLPAALLGLAAASWAIDTRSSPWSSRAALATSALAIVLLFAGSWMNIFARLGSILVETVAAVGRWSLRRLVLEIAVVAIALTGILLIRQRGFEAAPEEAGIDGFDPFLTATPVLLALAVGIVTVRVFPLPVKLLAWLSRRLRGSVLFIGLRRMAGQPATAYLPMVAMLLTVGLSISSAIVNNSVEEAQEDYAWRQVRADYRVDRGSSTGDGLPAHLTFADVPGVAAQAREFRPRETSISAQEEDGSFDEAPPSQSTLDLIAIESDAYSRIVAESPVRTVLPAGLSAPPSGANPPGSLENPVPALLSTTWPASAGDRPALGDLIRVSISAPQFTRPVALIAQVIDMRDEVPALTADEPFLLVGWEPFRAAVAEQRTRPLLPTSIYIDASGLSNAELDAAIREQIITPELEALGRRVPLGVATVSRAETLDQLRDAPLTRGLRGSFLFSTALAAGYAVLAIIIALVLGARDRARDVGFLRTMGLSRAQTFLISLVETVPAIIAGGLIGIGLGLVIARLIEPGIDLTAFVGPNAPVKMTTDWPVVALIAAGIIAAALASVLAFSALARRVQLGDVLRLGDR